MTPEELNRKAKIEALRNLREQNFYEPELDNPEGLNLDEDQPSANAPMAQPQQMPIQPAPQDPSITMQADPQNLMDALKRKRESELMKSLFPEGRERQ